MNLSTSTDELRSTLAATEGGRRWIRRGVISGAVVLLLAAGLGYRVSHRPPPPAKYITQEISTGDVAEKVQATGVVQPVLQVNIGSQVSGRVAKVYVDYNAIVHKGDILAEIDPSILGTQVTQQEASLSAQRAQLLSLRANQRTAQSVFDRTKKLFEQNLASRADLDTVRGQFESATALMQAQEANLGTIQAQLAASKTNVGYATIRSEVDGVVITRSIDPGATVAASFQTPVLFVIAQDLRRMRVLADIDEADVGKLREKMNAEAVVDAFPGVIFRGNIAQLRFSPNTVAGVVTYSAVIEVDNPEERLRPGMTATVTVKSKEANGTLRVPNAALRYRPSVVKGPDGMPIVTEPAKVEPPLAAGTGRVYLSKKNQKGEEQAEPLIVDIGVTDGIFTELKNATLPSGTRVITDELDAKKKGLF